MRRATQWAIFFAAWMLAGASWPAMFVREDEKRYLADNAGLDRRDADGNQSDGVEEAFWRLKEPGRFTHDLKNVGHEVFKANAKFYYKFSGFLFDLLLIANVVGWVT